MPYVPTVWVDGVTKLGPTNLNKLEEGVEAAQAAAEAAQADIDANVSPRVLFVSSAGDDANSGQNWAEALLTIQAAVDAASASGGIIYVDAGTYAPFTITTTSSAGRIEVRGVGEAIVSVTGTDAVGVTVTGYGIVGPVVENFLIEGAGAAATQIGVRLAGAGRATLRRLRIANCLIGIDFYNDASLFTERNRVEDSLINDCGTGIRFYRTGTGAQSMSYNVVSNVGIDGALTVGLDLGGSSVSAIGLYGCRFEDVAVWAQDSGMVGTRIAADMRGVHGHIVNEWQAGVAATGVDVTTAMANMDEAFLELSWIGSWPTQLALAAGTFLRTGARRTRDELRNAGEGFKGESFPRVHVQAASVPTAGVINGQLVGLRKGDLITSLYVGQSVAGTSVTLFKLGVYDSAGNRLALTSDLSAAANSASPALPRTLGGALTSALAITADGAYYLALLSVSGTSPTLIRAVNLSAHNFVVGSGLRPTVQLGAGGQTDLAAGPLSLNAAGVSYWIAWA